MGKKGGVFNYKGRVGAISSSRRINYRGGERIRKRTTNVMRVNGKVADLAGGKKNREEEGEGKGGTDPLAASP